MIAGAIPLHVRAKARRLREERRKQEAPITKVPHRFGVWLAETPDEFKWTADHFLEMQDRLDRVTSGEIRRVFFSIPIRHGKSEHNTIRYAVYRLVRDPKTRIILGSYNQTKANKFSRAIRKMAARLGVVMSKDRTASEEWETEAGGGLRAVGANGGVAGENADIIIIDDPIGARADAESQAERDRVWDWITNDLLGRCEPHTAVLFTMSRWHTDDPAGRLIDQLSDMWEIVDLPGEAEENDPLGRDLGEPLWPEFRDKAWLEEKRRELNEYGYASLIQGRPRPRIGGMFKWDWWQPLGAVPLYGPMVRYWDLAGTEPSKKKKGNGNTDPDFSAGMLACRMQDDRTAFVHLARARKSVAARDAWLEQIAREDIRRYGLRVCWWIETEAGIAGTDRTKKLIRRLQALGLAVYDEHPTGSKVLRAEPLASKAEAGNVVLCPDDPENPWHDDFRLEAADFPHGSHDDAVDAAAGADSKLDDPQSTVGFTNVSR